MIRTALLLTVAVVCAMGEENVCHDKTKVTTDCLTSYTINGQNGAIITAYICQVETSKGLIKPSQPHVKSGVYLGAQCGKIKTILKNEGPIPVKLGDPCGGSFTIGNDCPVHSGEQ